MLKRHEIQVLRRAGHTWDQVAALTGVSVGTARRVAQHRPLSRALLVGTRGALRRAVRRFPCGAGTALSAFRVVPSPAAAAAPCGQPPHDSLGRVPPLTFLPRPSSAGQSPIELSA